MKNIFTAGDVKIHRFKVTDAEVAAFSGEEVHPVCSTFALAREMEWSSRLFVLEMKEEDEEGIGTRLTIEHKSPALLGEELLIEAQVERLVGHELICTIRVKAGERLIAEGTTGQKVLKKEKLEKIFSKIKNG
ncbi:thioesterase family protein [Nafulsella turpanensis]|uniref:thioesterase family protein n=1 Tax=Nafulsella turpanensis TaxID=1265690 RepID=UPI000348B587|nr:hotdog domain-containing protein [Nafulsella turpanensis]